MPPNDGSRPTLTDAQLRAVVETSHLCARTSSPVARRRALLRLLRSLVGAELVAVWVGRSARTNGGTWPVPGATRGLVGRSGARASPRGTPLVVRTRRAGEAAVVAVWRATDSAGVERAQALLRALGGWVARTFTDDPPQPARGPTLVDADLRAEQPAFLLYLASLVAAPAPRARGAKARLTGREEEVAREVAAGRTNAEIAARLGLSEYTVKQHLKGAFRKLGVARRAGLAAVLERAPLGG